MSRSDEQQNALLQYTDDPSSLEKLLSATAPKTQRRCNIFQSAVVCLITSIVWILLLLVVQAPSIPTSRSASSAIDKLLDPSQTRHNVTSGATLLKCGSSSTEALAAGCKYDILLNHWVPEPCFDQEFIDEYKDDRSWTAFEDETLMVPISAEDMPNRDFYWTSIRDHVNHCAMIWRKQFWVLFEERNAIDTIMASGGHTEHCSQYLEDAMEMVGGKPTRTEVGFAGCYVKQ